jgi:membrane protein DedA with SNARE-associated domain
MIEFIHQINSWLIEVIVKLGYFGIFLGMFLESTLVPIPSEAVMIPAGMAVAKQQLNFVLVVFFGIFGNVLGAVFSYYLALWLGKPILLKVGRFFWIKPQTITKIEIFFLKYGEISVFVGRLLPGFRHFISIPAGIAKMNITKFLFYTTLGSTIWTTILVIFGYYFSLHQEYLLNNFKIIIVFLIIILLLWTFYKYKKSKNVG